MPSPLPMSATDTAGDLFLSGTYVELGISGYGNFGTTQGQTPAGYAQAGMQGVGLTFNAAGFGVDPTIPTIDFFTPGEPYESFAAGYTRGGTNTTGANYKFGAQEGITATSLTDTSSGSTLSARWVGMLSGNLRVTIDYSFGAADEFFTTTVTLTNLSGAAMTDVRYDREVDPDNTEFAPGVGFPGFTTTNTIVGQASGGGASEVTATSSTTDAYAVATGSPATLAYYSTNANTRVADGLNFGGTLNPFDPAFTSGPNTTGADDGATDTAININFDGGALAAGASTSFNYITAVTNHISTVLPSGSAPAAPTLTLSPGSDSGVAGDGITNDTRPVLTGTSVAGSTVTITDLAGNVVLGTAVADGSGAWSFTEATALTQGVHHLSATASVSGGPASVASTTLAVTIDSVAPGAPNIVLATASDSGVLGDGITNDTRPRLMGSAAAGSTVTIRDLTDGATLGTAIASGSGAWSFVPGAALAQGLHRLSATATDIAGNASVASTTLRLTIDSIGPAVTAAFAANPLDATSGGLVYSPILAGGGAADATVTITANGKAIGTAHANATGAWSFDPTGLAVAGARLVASETDAAGNTGSSAAITLAEPAIRFVVTNQTATTSGRLVGSDYSGPVSYLKAQFAYIGTDNVVIGAVVPNAFLLSGSGNDALQALGGSNVLDGGTGSNWLVGSPGADGGHDTFFVDARDNLATWDTLINFHVGDMLTEWGYDNATGSVKWVDGQGVAGYKGATLETSPGTAHPAAFITFDGLSTSNAHFAISNGAVGGVDYLAVTRTA